MPYSYKTWDNLIQGWVWAKVPPLAPILDVGAGAGKLAKLLRATHPRIDAAEIWAPYVERFRLATLYRRVWAGEAGDVRVLDTSAYALVLMGDVLEHLAICEAAGVLDAIRCAVLVQVPFKLAQGQCEGNECEEHKQPDLTPEVMAARFPRLRALDVQRHGGLYVQEARG